MKLVTIQIHCIPHNQQLVDIISLDLLSLQTEGAIDGCPFHFRGVRLVPTTWEYGGQS